MALDRKISRWLRYGPQDTSSRLIIARALAKMLCPLTSESYIPDTLLLQVQSLRGEYRALVDAYILALPMPFTSDDWSYIRQVPMLVLENTLIASLADLPKPALVFWAPGFERFSKRVRGLEEANGALYASLLETFISFN